MLGFCPAGNGSVRDSLAPFSAAQMPRGDRNWQQELGFTQDSIYSHPGERMEDTEVKIATKSFRGFLCGLFGCRGRVSGAQSEPNPRINSW